MIRILYAHYFILCLSVAWILWFLVWCGVGVGMGWHLRKWERELSLIVSAIKPFVPVNNRNSPVRLFHLLDIPGFDQIVNSVKRSHAHKYTILTQIFMCARTHVFTYEWTLCDVVCIRICKRVGMGYYRRGSQSELVSDSFSSCFFLQPWQCGS